MGLLQGPTGCGGGVSKVHLYYIQGFAVVWVSNDFHRSGQCCVDTGLPRLQKHATP